MRRLAALIIAALAGFARAQSATDLQIEPPEQPLACLTSTTPERKVPAYPTGLPLMTNAVVRVRLVFAAPDAPPVARVVFNSGGSAFETAVVEHVMAYRLPCLRAGKQFDGVQEFQFVASRPTPSVLQSVARDANGALSLTAECLSVVRAAAPPKYPRFAAQQGQQGLVLVRLTFVGPDLPPQVTVLFDGGQRYFSDAVRDSVAAYRMPCLKTDDEPLVVQQPFSFVQEGGRRSELRMDLTLQQLLGAVQDLDQYKVRFDFTTMACPFQVQLQLLQPYARNVVRELGEANANRREFVEWLRNVALKLPERLQRTVLGSTTTVSVLCSVLDLS